MNCSECGTSTILFSLPDEYRKYSPSEAAFATVCPHCLSLEPAPNPDSVSEKGIAASEDATTGNSPDFTRISDAFPAHPERAIPMILAIGLCSSLATNRTAIELLLKEVERTGTDPLLVFDRLSDDPSVDPVIDLDRRQHQLEQLLY
ncbi:DUF6276 family protein [Natrinema halophilum]|uniref:Uncharacterized protein n=1 Tax=Natrinema halophilum TaxID=1699371 RepID=A0A7D5GHZ9_9EURY|nr:DUF6276 family protein [Natrinema halophilum]QLG49508.1 DUF6276 family protein [Natrinema halophilum]